MQTEFKYFYLDLGHSRKFFSRENKSYFESFFRKICSKIGKRESFRQKFRVLFGYATVSARESIHRYCDLKGF